VIGLDCNILVRYLTQDDPVQAALARDVLENRLSADDEPGFVSIVAMAETVWVLDRHYHFTNEQIVAAVESLLQADVLVVENEADVFAAITALRERRGEFADALIGALCTKAGCTRVYSFDRGALRLPGFEHP
jgi:predicted nucleic-acid-binding protein